MAQDMNAIRFHAFGGPEVLVLERAARPEPGSGEVLVEVKAAGVNPIDIASRAGAVVAPLWGENPFPVVTGWDFSGVVAGLGEGVTRWSVGDEVYGMPRFPMIGGCYADYVAVPADEIARKPAKIDHEHAAGVPLAGLTAWQSIEAAGGLRAGQRFLMHAAAGGVGHLAVQIAKARGASVIGTGSARNADFVRGLGADEYVDYTKAKFEDVLADIDLQIDTFGGEFTERCWKVMRKGAMLVSIRGVPSEDDAETHGVRAAGVRVRPDAPALDALTELIEAGALTPVLDAVYPLAEAAKAHEHVAGGHSRGKIVLKITR